MDFIRCERSYFKVIDYRDYIVNNLSEFGCAIFPAEDYVEFDIDDPRLSIKATDIKTRNLNIKSLKASELFCGHLRCIQVDAKKIYAESIECVKYSADEIRTNFKYGIKINKAITLKERTKNFAAIIPQVKNFGGGYQEVLAQFVKYGFDDKTKFVAFEEMHLFIFGISQKHQETLKREYDFSGVTVLENPL